jgi:hypothetical protein
MELQDQAFVLRPNRAHEKLNVSLKTAQIKIGIRINSNGIGRGERHIAQPTKRR